MVPVIKFRTKERIALQLMIEKAKDATPAKALFVSREVISRIILLGCQKFDLELDRLKK